MPGGDGTPGHMVKFIAAQLFCNAPKPTASFAGQTIIITGSNTGLGFEGAKYAVKLGCAKLIIAVRSVDKGEAAKRSIIQETGCDPNIMNVWHLDLTSYASVKSFAARADKELERVDVLLENAAVGSVEWNRVEDNERMVTINVVSTFLLAFLLLPKLKATATKFNTRPRLTFVTSDTHFLVDFEERNAPEGIFNRLNDKAKSVGSMSERYPTTKLMQIFIAREMAARLMHHPTTTTAPEIIVNCPNPGMCHSELSREIDGWGVRIAKFLLARTAEQGARSLIAGAVGGVDTHGRYLDMGRVREPASVVVGPRGEETQRRLYGELMGKLDEIVPGVSGNL